MSLDPFPGLNRDSGVYGTNGEYQVGSVYPPGVNFGGHAALWHGTAESFVDLNAFLPAGYSGSGAAAVWEYDGHLYIAGVAALIGSDTSEAFLWIGPVPGPGSALPLLAAGGWAGWRRRRP